MSDALDAVSALGYRVVWVSDLPSGLLLLRAQRIVLADPDRSREAVAAVALELIEGRHE